MNVKKEQFCDYCGESCGVMYYSRRDDGPLSCGAKDCERECRNDHAQRREEAAMAAQEDGYSRYGGW